MESTGPKSSPPKILPLIVLLGAAGYIGQAFAEELERRQYHFLPLSRKNVDYANFDTLARFLRERKPAFLINAAGFTGKPNVDACETTKSDTIAGNTLLPQTIADACAAEEIPWGHVSSGCIYSGAKIVRNGSAQVERDMTRPDLRALVEQSPAVIRGFTEADKPNMCFREPPC